MAVIPVESEKRGMGMFRTVIGLFVIFFVASSSSRAEKPNVIVVMADDLDGTMLVSRNRRVEPPRQCIRHQTCLAWRVKV